MSDFWMKFKGLTRKVLIWTGIILVLGTILFVLFIRYTSYSSGYRAGEVIKFSHKGFVFKTYEGEMNLGGFRNTDQQEITPTIWAFSVYPGDDEVRQQIIRAMENGGKVRLHYKERFARLFWYGDTKYFIDKVELIQ